MRDTARILAPLRNVRDPGLLEELSAVALPPFCGRLCAQTCEFSMHWLVLFPRFQSLRRNDGTKKKRSASKDAMALTSPRDDGH